MRSVQFVVVGAALMSLTAEAYLPPVDERDGIRVEIGTFPQRDLPPPKGSTVRPLGVTEVKAGAPRGFPVTITNKTDRAVEGDLGVWLNDDWDVTGPSGALALAPKAAKTLDFTATARPRALNALYPVHARFVPKGGDPDRAPHPVAIFKHVHPNAPRARRPVAKPQLGRGTFALASFPRTVAVEVGGQVHPLAADGNAREYGGGMTVCGDGWSVHPPYLKGAGFVMSDLALDLPSADPLLFSSSIRIGSNLAQPGVPPSDGVEFKVFVVEGTSAPQEVRSVVVTDPTQTVDLTADLSSFAGKSVTLRLWTGPGPRMNTCCDGASWTALRLHVGERPVVTDEAVWRQREAEALARAKAARTAGTDEAAGRWQLPADDAVYGAGAVEGPRGLVDGALAFTDGERSVVYRGFTASVLTGDCRVAPPPKATIRAERGTLRVSWSIPGATRDVWGYPRIGDLAVGPANERLFRVYAGTGNVIEHPRRFTLHQNGFDLSTRHVGADYANGLSVVQAVDIPPDTLQCDGANRLFSLHAHLDATFTFVPSAKGAFAAARRFRAVAGYRKSPGRGKLGGRMCLDQWGGDYARAAKDIRLAGKCGLNDAVFVKHVWQRWGYDYRLPEIYPPAGDRAAFADMARACRETGILFCPHDNYTDIYPDAENYSYDLVVFNLDGTPQLAWYNEGRRAQSYRWAPHAFHPWALRNAKLLREGCAPEAIFIDVLTAHGPFDYLDRAAHYHSKAETSAAWAKAFKTYRAGFGCPDAVCVSEAGQDHLVGVADAGQSDHFPAARWMSRTEFDDAERTPWHDIVTHGNYVLFAGGLGARYQEPGWHRGGDAELHGYGSDDYLSNCIVGGRNPMAPGPFGRIAVATYWLQHDACAELGQSEFLDLRYEGDVHRQHAFFSDGGEVWVNRATNGVWKLPNGVALPPYGYYAKTRRTESGVVAREGVRCAFAKAPGSWFCDARTPSRQAKAASAERDRLLGVNRAGRTVDFGGLRTNGAFRLADWTLTPLPNASPFTAEIDLAAFGRPEGRVAAVEPVEPERGAAVPEWKQEGTSLRLKADARAFAYRVRFE